MDSGQFDCQEPSVEEHGKILERRVRSNKISEIMAEYLLKGYRMLASTCPACGTVLLSTKSGKTFCIACEQLDNNTNLQCVNHPVEPPRNSTGLSGPSSALVSSDVVSDRVVFKEGEQTNMTICSNPKRGPKMEESPKNLSEQKYASSEIEVQILSRAIGTVLDSMERATRKLEHQNELDQVNECSVQCASLIRACAEALYFLRRLE